jgi:hypothetical protein
MTLPFIKFHSLTSPKDYYVVRAGRAKRPYLDQTHNSHGYLCQAVVSSHLAGWEILLPQDVEIIWDGVSDSSSEHVKVLSGGRLPNGMQLVQTDTANATITFNLNAIIETDSDHDIVLCGPPNFFVNGVEPMSAIIQTDWYSHNPLQFCWKINKPNEVVRFEAGTPFVFFFNRPKSLLENTDISVVQIGETISRNMAEYADERQSFYRENKPWSWSGMYKDGISKLSQRKQKLASNRNPKPKDPRYEQP